MKFHFSIYNSRHYGLQLNHIDNITFQQLLREENLNFLVLDVDIIYYIDIAYDYCYWNNPQDFKIYRNEPEDPEGNLFSLAYNRELGKWKTTCI